MKKLVLSAALLLGLAMSAIGQKTCTMTRQPKTATKWTKAKDETVTTKTCLYWLACPDMEVVEFRVTNTSVVTLVKRDEKTYVEGGDKLWEFYIEDDILVFQSGKKAFLIRP